MLLHDAVINEYPYRATEHGGRKKKRFHNDLMQLLEQYQEQGFALGLKCGLMLAGELFYCKTL